MKIRTAHIGRRNGVPKVETVERYLPSNYTIKAVAEDYIIIRGEDYAGWTLDDYVIPRLASGLIFTKEVPDDARP